jgi:polycomb protein EED
MYNSVRFYHDLVLSRGHEEGHIVLWQITGFSPAEVPSASAAPTTYDQSAKTRSAFFKAPKGDKTAQRLYKRLLQFATPQCNQWYMRFSLYTPYSSSKHHVLAMCNSVSKVHFWDFSRLADYQKFIISPATVPKPSWLSLKSQNKKSGKADGHRLLSQTLVDESVASSSVSSFSTESLAAAIDIEANRSAWDEKYWTGNPWKSLKAHKIEGIPRVTTVGRAVAWSDDGDFCVVVGSSGIISVLERWARSTPNIKADKNAANPDNSG